MTAEVHSLDDLKGLQEDLNAKYVLFFWADWHEPSKKGGQMQGIYSALAEKYPKIKFLLVEAEAALEVSEKYEVSVVPTFFTCVGPKTVGQLQGATPATLSKLVKELEELTDISSIHTEEDRKKAAEKEALNKRLEQLVRRAPVMLFMKGNTSQPKCGFSRQMVELLTSNHIPFASFDILQDEAVRQGLKEFSDWPTYPQLYVHGQLIGGLDIAKELAQGGNLKEQLGIKDIPLPPPPNTEALNDRLVQLINQAPVMLFMKGTADSPRCGFSSQMVSILKEKNIDFSTFDILSDEEVRQGLKEFSDWPTYPQLYAKGQLIGGLDIVKEMIAGDADLKSQLGL